MPIWPWSGRSPGGLFRKATAPDPTIIFDHYTSMMHHESMTASEWMAFEDETQLATYRKWPIPLVKASGAMVEDVEGNHYLDLYGGAYHKDTPLYVDEIETNTLGSDYLDSNNGAATPEGETLPMSLGHDAAGMTFDSGAWTGIEPRI